MVARKYTKRHWDEFQRLVTTGMGENSALRELGIPSGSLGTLKARFSSREPAALPEEPISPPVPSESIGDLERALHDHAEELLELASQMSELTKHAHGLVLLDATMGQLAEKHRESSVLRHRLEAAEVKLIERAMVVHSND
jgi:hypothetical protein